MAEAANVEEIATLAAEWNVSVSAAQVEKISQYFELLLHWNARVNLTGARSLGELVAEHLPDSFALARLTPSDAAVVDVGAGGGLPAVPFGLLRPDCETTLVEPRAKRTAFLAAAKRAAGVGATLRVVRGRDEDLAAASFDVAASRATFPPEEWLRVAARLVRPSGRVIVFATSAVVDLAGCFDFLEGARYRTAQGAPRWAGAFVPRGTSLVRL
jgi:16S rRNA (guanine527-N7)-methyltransferase